MHKVRLSGYTLQLEDGLPLPYASYSEHARNVDEIDIRNAEDDLFFLGIATCDTSWPTLVSAQK